MARSHRVALGMDKNTKERAHTSVCLCSSVYTCNLETQWNLAPPPTPPPSPDERGSLCLTGATCSRTCCRHRRHQLADGSCFTSNTTTTNKLSCKVKMGLGGWGMGCFFFFFLSASIFAKFRSPCEVFSSSYSRTGLIPLNLTGGKFASRQGSERLWLLLHFLPSMAGCPPSLPPPPHKRK